jgi:hypothetical protein
MHNVLLYNKIFWVLVTNNEENICILFKLNLLNPNKHKKKKKQRTFHVFPIVNNFFFFKKKKKNR